VLWLELNECVCSMRCFAKFELWPFVLNADLCSLNRATKVLPVGPTYVLLESGHVSLYIPDCVYFSDLSFISFCALLILEWYYCFVVQFSGRSFLTRW